MGAAEPEPEPEPEQQEPVPEALLDPEPEVVPGEKEESIVPATPAQPATQPTPPESSRAGKERGAGRKRGGRSSKSRDGSRNRGAAKDPKAIDAVPDELLDSVDVSSPSGNNGQTKHGRFGTKVKQSEWRVKGAVAKISGAAAAALPSDAGCRLLLRHACTNPNATVRARVCVPMLRTGEKIEKSTSARKQMWVVGRITDVDGRGKANLKYATPKNETKEEWVPMGDLEKPSSAEIKAFEGRTLAEIGGRAGFTQEQLAVVSCTKGMIMKLGQALLDQQSKIDIGLGRFIGVVVQNPEPDTVLQWKDGEQSDLLSPADLVKPTEKEKQAFKDSRGWAAYLKNNTRTMKEEINADKTKNADNAYWGPNVIVKFEASPGVWKLGRILNDHTKGLIGEEPWDHGFDDDRPRKTTKGEVQMLMTDNKLSPPIRITRLQKVDKAEIKQFSDRLSYTYSVMREDNEDPEGAIIRMERIEAAKKREEEVALKAKMRQEAPLDESEPERNKITLLDKYIDQHGLGTDLIRSTDERPWDRPEPVPESQLFVVLNVPQRLSSAEQLCTLLNHSGCHTSKRSRIYKSMTVYSQYVLSGVEDVYAILHYKMDPNKKHTLSLRGGQEKVHDPINITKLDFSATEDEHGRVLKIVPCTKRSKIQGPHKAVIKHDVKRRLETRPEKMSRWQQISPWPLPYDPDSVQRQVWNVILLVLCFYVALAVPVQVFFQTEDYVFFFKSSAAVVWLVEKTTDLVFILDILLNFRTGYYDDEGHLVTDAKRIAVNYLRTWFLVDVLSVMPYELIPAANMFKLFRMVRLMKLLRVLRLKKLFNQGQLKTGFAPLDHAIHFVMKWSKPLTYLGGTLYIAHFLACVWFFVGTSSPEAPPVEEPEPELSGPPPPWHPHTDYVAGSEGWISVAVGNGHMPGSEPSLWTKYVASFYWAITVLSTVGYGDIFPITNEEKFFSIVVQVIGCMVFGSLTGALASHKVNATRAGEKVAEEMACLQEFFDTNHIPPKLQDKVRRIAKYKYKKNALDEEELLGELPSNVLQELKDASSGGDKAIYRQIPVITDVFMAHGDHRLENAIMTDLKRSDFQSYADTSEPIYKEGDMGADKEIYFIIKGRVLLSSIKSDAQYVIEEGSFFGERELFFERGIDGTYNAPSEAALARGVVNIEGRPRQHTAKVVSDGVAEMVYVKWVDLLKWTELGKDKDSLVDPSGRRRVREGEYILERIRTKAADRVLQDDHFMVKKKRDSAGVEMTDLTRYKYEGLRRQMVVPISDWVEAIFAHRANSEIAGNERRKRTKAFRVARDDGASAEDKEAARNFAASHIQKAWRKKNKQTDDSDRPTDLREVIENETSRVERTLDSVASDMKDEMKGLDESIEGEFARIMEYVQVNAADKNDVEVRVRSRALL
jgi:hypothetical protein